MFSTAPHLPGLVDGAAGQGDVARKRSGSDPGGQDEAGQRQVTATRRVGMAPKSQPSTGTGPCIPDRSHNTAPPGQRWSITASAWPRATASGGKRSAFDVEPGASVHARPARARRERCERLPSSPRAAPRTAAGHSPLGRSP